MHERLGVDPLPVEPLPINKNPTRICLTWPYIDAQGVEQVEQLCVAWPINLPSFA